MHRDNLNINKSIAFSGTIIIIVFIVLCLTVMAVLSFTTANSDYKLTNKAQNKIVDYYNIHGQAEEKLSDIQGIIILMNSLSSDTIDNNFDKENYILMLNDKLKVLKDVYIENNSEYFIIHYEVKGKENQKINVELKYDYTSKGKYEVISWNLSNIELPEYSDNLNLWGGMDINENY